MKGLRRKFRRGLAGFLAFCLTATSFNMVSWADVQNAFENENAIFIMTGEDLRDTAQAAVDAGEVLNVEDLGLGDKDKSLKKDYEKLFGGTSVYEFLPSYNMDDEACADGAELRMFVRVPGMQEGYQLTGDEEIIFLYVNGSENKITFQSNIDGYLTQKVNVKAFSESTAALPGAGEGIVKPEESKPEESKPEESLPEETTENSDELKPELPTIGAEETTEAVPETEESLSPDNTTDVEESGDNQSQEANVPEEEIKDNDTVDEVPAADADDSDSPSDNEAEAAEEAAPAEDTSSNTQVSVSKHMLPALATAVENEIPETEEPVENEPVENEPVENEPAENEPTLAETVMAQETEAEVDEKETVTDAVIDGDLPLTDNEQSEENVEPDGIGEEEQTEIKGYSKGKTYNVILLDESYYARAYVATINKLTEEEETSGYAVHYVVEPVGAAVINGAKSVEDGESLDFSVKPQVGYIIQDVTVNGESIMEDEIATDSQASGSKHSYTIADVSEDIEVNVYLEETMDHPEFNYDSGDQFGDIRIVMHAEEGILPAGVTADIKEVTANVADAVKANGTESMSFDLFDEDGQLIEKSNDGDKASVDQQVVAYDIVLKDADSNKLDDSWSRDGGYVTVTFSGNKISEMSQNAAALEVVHVNTDVDATEKQLKESDIKELNIVSEMMEVPGEESINEIAFQANHFSIYAVSTGQTSIPYMNKGQTLKIELRTNYYNVRDYEWSSSEPDIIQIKSQDDDEATIYASNEGTAVLKCTYEYKNKYTSSWRNGSDSQTIKVIDNLSNPDDMIQWTRSSAPTQMSGGNELKWDWNFANGIKTPITNYNEVWDGTKPGHRYEGYLKQEQVRYGATWVQSGNLSMERFKGTFSVDDEFSVADDMVRLTSYLQDSYTSINGGRIVPINDNLFVFVYPEGTVLNNSNFMQYLAFWSGTSNQSNSIKKFNGVEGTPARRYSNTSSPEWKDLQITDGWYVEASVDNIGKVMYEGAKKAVDGDEGRVDEVRNYVIDIFTEDNAAGGGMDQMVLNFTKVGSLKANNDAVTGKATQQVNFNVLSNDEVRDANGDIQKDAEIKLAHFDSEYTENGISYTIVNGNASVNGTKVGTISISEDGSSSFTSVPGYSGSFKFRYDAKFKGRIDSAIVTITIDSLSYNIKYHYQSPNTGDDCTRVFTMPTNAGAGSIISLTDAQKNPKQGLVFEEIGYGKFNVDNFSYQLEKVDPNDGNLTLKGDGTSIFEVYFKLSPVGYTVEYRVNNETGTELLTAKNVPDQMIGAIVEEQAAVIPGYHVDQDSKSLKLKATGNKIVFIYKADTNISYDVEYRLGSETGIELAAKKSVSDQIMGTTVNETAEVIPGYSVDLQSKSLELKATGNKIIFIYTADANISYEVEYRQDSETGNVLFDSKTVIDQTMGTTVNETAVEISGYTVDQANKQLELKATGNKIIFIYKANTNISYDVEYRQDSETGNVLADSKTVNDQTMGTTVNEAAAVISGYTVDQANKELELKATGNKIVFIYKADINISYDVEYRQDSETGKVLANSKTVNDQIMGTTVNETAEVIPGYTVDLGTKTLELKATGNKIVFIYTANQDIEYRVEYRQNNINGTELADAKTVSDQIMGTTVTENAIEIPGYTPSDETKSIELHAVGNLIVFVYTANNDITYNVEYRLGNADGEKLASSEVRIDQIMGETVIERAKQIAGYTVDEATKSLKLESAGNKIVFIYNANTDISYDVEYRQDSATGKVLADGKTVNDQTMGTTVNEIAAVIPGYTVDQANKELELNATGNKIIFIYKADTNISYDVEYRQDSETGKVLADSKNVKDQTMGTTVNETAADIPGYTVDQAAKELELKATGNKIIFIYKANTNIGYDVEYRQDSETGKVLVDSKTVNDQIMGTTVNEAAPEIPGYTVDQANKGLELKATGNKIIFIYKANTNISYDVEYRQDSETGKVLVDSKTVNDQIMGTTVNETAEVIPGYTVDQANKELELKAAGNKIIFIYKADTNISYDVEYRQDSAAGKVLADGKTVNDQTMGTTVSEAAALIPGYTVDQANKELELKSTGNKIIFIYKANTNIGYDVEYRQDSETGKILADSKTVNDQTMGTTVNEAAALIPGYTVDQANKELELKATGNKIVFIYKADTNISYDVEYRQDSETGKVLADSKTVNNQTMGTTVNEAAAVISGYTVDLVNKELELKATGNKIIFIYKANQDIEYRVEYRQNSITGTELADAKTVLDQVMGTTVTENSIEIPGYTPADETKSIELHAAGNLIVFVYTANNDITYNVEYRLGNAEGEKLATSEIRIDQVMGETVIERAKQIAGYTVDEATKSLKLEAAENKIVFIYKANTDISYDVEYRQDSETGKVLAEGKTVNDQTMGATVNETAAEIPGYTVDQATKELELKATGNKIIFIYKANTNIGYDVEYRQDSVTGKVLADSKTINDQTMGTTVSEAAAVIPGYTVDQANKELELKATGNKIIFIYKANTNISYDVEYRQDSATGKVLADSKTVNDQTMGTTVNETAAEIPGYTVDQANKQLELRATGNKIIFIYKANTNIGYDVEYRQDSETGKVLADSKTVNDQTMGTTVNEAAAVIPGYTVDQANKELELKATGNKIVFIYKADTNISYDVEYRQDSETGKILADSKTVNNQTMGTTVNETAAEIPGYTVDLVNKGLELQAAGNKIIFIYNANTNISYDVEYRQGSETGKVLADSKTVNDQTMGATVNETAAEIPGYTVDQVNKELELKATGNKIIFIYKANTNIGYDVEYRQDSETGKVLADSKTVNDQTMGTTVNEAAATIPGYTVDQTDKELELKATGNKIVFIYKADTNISYDVEYRQGSETGKVLANSKTVNDQTMGTTVNETAAEIPGYTVDLVSKELELKAAGNKIVFIYTANQDIEYRVEYRQNSITGTELADAKTVSDQIMGTTVTENSIEIPGYTPADATKSIELHAAGNLIVFVYTANNDITYNVEYRLGNAEGEKLASSEVRIDQIMGETVTERAIQIAGYTVDEVTKSLKLEAAGNKIVFIYKAYTNIIYDVEYRQDSTTGKVLAAGKTVTDQTMGTTINEAAAVITGYTVDQANKELELQATGNKIVFIYTADRNISYDVEYRQDSTTGKVLAAGKTVSDQTMGTTINEAAAVIPGYTVDQANKELELKASENKIVFIYKANSNISYNVEYRQDSVTGKVLADSKTVLDQIMGSTVTENAKEIMGYQVDSGSKSLELVAEGNVLVFIYSAKQYQVTYLVDGIQYGDAELHDYDTTVIVRANPEKSGYTFSGWSKRVSFNMPAENVVIEGTFTRNSTGGGGGGGGPTPDSNRPSVPGGPGDTITINPADVPLANLPSGTGNAIDSLIIIDDGNVPLAGLPKTGDRSVGIAAILSGILLAAYIALSGKKKEEQ